MEAFVHRHRWGITLVAHALLAGSSLALAYLLRFEFSLPESESTRILQATILAVIVKSITFELLKLNRAGWRYAGIADLGRSVRANIVASVAFVAAGYAYLGPSMPRSVYAVDFLLCFLSTAAYRLTYRIYKEISHSRRAEGQKDVLIYGAGDGGVSLLKEIRSNPSVNYRVVGFIDDAPQKHSSILLGVPVMGGGHDIPSITQYRQRRGTPIQEILIAMPSSSASERQGAVANCRAAGIPCKTVPGLSDLLTGSASIRQVRDVSVLDLLGRSQVQLGKETVHNFLQGRNILITGGAGSIGSEICRQVSTFSPASVVAFDQAESDLFRIELEMKGKDTAASFHAEIGDIRDKRRLQEVIEQHNIDCIFHAAAYKHVPMMENHALQAIQNNIFGTKNVIEAAYEMGVSDFVMISSDKAVRPTNVMGLTKRIAELLTLSMPSRERGGTKFASVRFGNVLGSNGSVIPLFKQQIERGGPVTVTHPDIRRYFMTISEAVELVLQSSTMSKSAEIFVLDMGEPIRIVDLAENMIRLAGLEPGQDIEIRFSGLRPGEKLHEELMLDEEGIMPTYHSKIKILQSAPVDRVSMQQRMRDLAELVEHRDVQSAIELLNELVPEYNPGLQWRRTPVEAQHLTAVSGQ